MSQIKRRKTPSVKVGRVFLGNGHPIVIQSMTNTPTADVEATVRQIKELVCAGSEFVRITVNDEAAMLAVAKIISALLEAGCTTPLIGDFHYNGHILLNKYPESAKLLSKYRINPGNIGKDKGRDKNFSQIIKIALKYDKPVRIGVNWGSLDKELLARFMDQNTKSKSPKDSKEIIRDAMVQSALESAKQAIKFGLKKTNLVLSVKMSDVQDMIAVYEKLAKECDYVLHLGLTEAGAGTQGIVASTVALGILLQKGIGDTIRISLTPQPNLPRSLEVEACKALLQSMSLRYFEPRVISCPGCGRTNSDYFQKLACGITEYIQKNMPAWKENYPGVEKLTIAVMGCVVNGPGESQHADLGISLPGTLEKPMATVFADGIQITKLQGERIKEEFIEILERYIKKRYSS